MEATQTERASISLAVRESVALTVRYPSAAIRPDLDLFGDLGMDSLMLVNLVLALEERLGGKLPRHLESKLATVRTVDDLTALVVEAKLGQTDPRWGS